MENCADHTAENAEDCFDCRCSTCRIVYAIWMLGKAIAEKKVINNDDVDVLQTRITKAWD